MSDVVTEVPAEATWQGTFQVDGQLINVPAHVGSAACTAIGLMTPDLHRDTIGTRGSVSGRLRVGAVTMSGTADTACGGRDNGRGSLQATLAPCTEPSPLPTTVARADLGAVERSYP